MKRARHTIPAWKTNVAHAVGCHRIDPETAVTEMQQSALAKA